MEARSFCYAVSARPCFEERLLGVESALKATVGMMEFKLYATGIANQLQDSRRVSTASFALRSWSADLGPPDYHSVGEASHRKAVCYFGLFAIQRYCILKSRADETNLALSPSQPCGGNLHDVQGASAMSGYPSWPQPFLPPSTTKNRPTFLLAVPSTFHFSFVMLPSIVFLLILL